MNVPPPLARRWQTAGWPSRRAVLLAAPLVFPSSRATAATTLTVFAATSLREAFTELGRRFESARRDVRVRLAFAGSQELRLQIAQGARADLFASADEPNMIALGRAGLVEAAHVFARNELAIVVERGNTAVRSLADLPRAQRLVIGAPEVPVGSYTLTMLARASRAMGEDFQARVLARVVSRELNVRQVMAKVALGEADAGIVYRSDGAAGGVKVRLVPIPADSNVEARYPVALLKESRNRELARAFIELLLSPEGQRQLGVAGFLPAVAP